MKIRTRMVRLCLLATTIILGSCASSQPKLTQQQVLDQYPQVAQLNSAFKNYQKGRNYLHLKVITLSAIHWKAQ